MVPSAATVVVDGFVVHGSGFTPGLQSHTCLSGVAGFGTVDAVVALAIVVGDALDECELELQAATMHANAVIRNRTRRVFGTLGSFAREK
jgi:hypothetical protein